MSPPSRLAVAVTTLAGLAAIARAQAPAPVPQPDSPGSNGAFAPIELRCPTWFVRTESGEADRPVDEGWSSARLFRVADPERETLAGLRRARLQRRGLQRLPRRPRDVRRRSGLRPVDVRSLP